MLLASRIPHTYHWNACPPDANPTTSRARTFWLSSVAIPLSLLGLLTALVRAYPSSGHDQAVLAWIHAWDLPGLAGFFTGVSLLTDNWPAMGVGIAGA